MGQIATANFDYSDLEKSEASKLQALAVYVEKAKASMAGSIVEIGGYVKEAKVILDDGKFKAWVESECRFSRATAYNYIRAHAAFAGSKLISRFDDSAVYLLTAPKAPESAMKKALKMAGNGEYITHAKAKELINGKPQASAQTQVSRVEILDTPPQQAIYDGEPEAPDTIPPESPKAQKATSLDGLKRPVPAALEPAFALCPRFRDFRNAINSALEMAKEIAGGPAGAFVHLQGVEADLKNAKSALCKMAPHAPCPYCKGRQCQTCRETGWLPRLIYDQAPEEKR